MADEIVDVIHRINYEVNDDAFKRMTDVLMQQLQLIETLSKRIDFLYSQMDKVAAKDRLQRSKIISEIQQLNKHLDQATQKGQSSLNKWLEVVGSIAPELGKGLSTAVGSFKATGSALSSLTSGFKAFSGAMSASGGWVTAVISVIAQVIPLIIEMTHKTEEVSEATKQYVQYLEDVGAAAGDEIATFENLYRTATNTSLVYRDRAKAVEQLQQLYPDYLGNISKEDLLNGELEKSHNLVTAAIIARAVETAKLAKVSKLAAENAQAQVQLDELNQPAYMYGRKVEKFIVGDLRQNLQNTITRTQEEIDGIFKGIQDEKSHQDMLIGDALVPDPVLQKQINQERQSGTTGKIPTSTPRVSGSSAPTVDPYQQSLKQLADTYEKAKNLHQGLRDLQAQETALYAQAGSTGEAGAAVLQEQEQSQKRQLAHIQLLRDQYNNQLEAKYVEDQIALARKFGRTPEVDKLQATLRALQTKGAEINSRLVQERQNLNAELLAIEEAHQKAMLETDADTLEMRLAILAKEKEQALALNNAKFDDLAARANGDMLTWLRIEQDRKNANADIETNYKHKAEEIDKQFNKQIGENYKSPQEYNSDRKKIKQAKREELAERLDEYNTLVQAAGQAFNTIAELEMKAMDKKIAAQEKRVEAAKKLTERGNTEAQKLEEERLRKLQQQREQWARRQQAVNAAMTLSSSITAVARAAAEGGGFGSIASIAALLGALAAGYATVKSLTTDNTEAFKDGVVGYRGKGGPRDDANWVRISAGESIINADATARNRALLEAVNGGAQFKMMQAYPISLGHVNNKNTFNDTKTLTCKMDGVIDAINGLTFNAENRIDGNGVHQIVETTARRQRNKWS